MAAVLAPQAHALEAKQCLPLAEMNATLKSEGQRGLVIGDRLALQNPTGLAKDASVIRYANIVTSNADGSLGYQFEGDLPRDMPSTRLCVSARLTNIRLYDIRKVGTPPDTKLGGQFDAMLAENEKIGTRPMVQADTMHLNADGTWRYGLPMTLLGNAEGRSAHLVVKKVDGQVEQLMIVGDADYTPHALQILDGRTK